MKKHLQPLTPATLYARVSSDPQDVDLSVSAHPKRLELPVRVASPGITGHLATIRRRFCLQWKKAPLPTYIHLHRVLRRLSDAEGGTREPEDS